MAKAQFVNLGGGKIGLQKAKGRVYDVTDLDMQNAEAGWSEAMIQLFGAMLDMVSFENFKLSNATVGAVTMTRKTQAEIAAEAAASQTTPIGGT